MIPSRLSEHYRPDIDGMRALAVGGVVLFHFGFGTPGGFAGVDVFFVISGFLITGIVLRQTSAGTFSMVRFMERRVRRIFPACASMVLISLLAGWVFMQPHELVSLAWQAIAQAALASNFYFSRGTDYFEPASELQPLLHTWSLAVEEQFYLIFPLLLAAAASGGVTRLRRMMLAFAITSVAAAVALAAWAPSLGFYWPVGRAWEFLVGGILALPHTPLIGTPRGRSIASIAGLTAIFCAYGITASGPMACLAASSLACGGAALLIECGHGSNEGAGSQLLGTRPLRAIGVLSYSIYLVHWPVAAFMRLAGNTSLTGWWAATGVGFTVLLGTLSWCVVERPMRHGLGAGKVRVTLALLIGVTALTVCTSTWFISTGGLPSRPVAIAAGPSPGRVPRDFAVETVEGLRTGPLPGIGACDHSAPTFAVWGDSHAMAISRTIDSSARAQDLCGVSAMRPATAPLLGTWREGPGLEQRDWNDEAWRAIQASGAKHVILVARWSINVDGRENGALDSLLSDAVTIGRDPASARIVMERGFTRTLDAIHAAGMDAWILLEPPQLALTRTQRAVRRAWLRSESDNPTDVGRNAEIQRTIRGIAEQLKNRVGVHVIDLSEPCLAANPTESDWNDRDHLSPEGAERLLRATIDDLLSCMRQRNR